MRMSSVYLQICMLILILALLIQKYNLINLRYKNENNYYRFVRSAYATNINHLDFVEYNGNEIFINHPEKAFYFDQYMYYWDDNHDDLKGFDSICEYALFGFLDAPQLSKVLDFFLK